MNILVLQASPNVHGSTALLVDGFSRGAREAGHKVTVADVCRMSIAPARDAWRAGTRALVFSMTTWTRSVGRSSLRTCSS